MSIDREATLAPENDAFSISTAALADRPAQATSTVIQSGWDAAEKIRSFALWIRLRFLGHLLFISNTS